MKKKMTLAFIAAIAGATAMALTSCSDENLAPSAGTGEDVCMTFTASLPAEISTYAYEDDAHPYMSSLEGGLRNLIYGGYYVRYIMEIYKYDDSAADKCGERVERQIKYNVLTDPKIYGDFRKMDFSGVRLKNDAKYIALFWSDIVTKRDKAPDCYHPENEGKTFTIDGVQYNNLTSLDGLNTTEYYVNPYFYSNPEEFYSNPKGDDSGAVLYSVINNYHVTDDSSVEAFFVPTDIRTVYASSFGEHYHFDEEMFDGFYATHILDLASDASKNHNIILKRPFAKMRLVTTDANKISEIAGFTDVGGNKITEIYWYNVMMMKVPSEGKNLFDEVKPVFNLITGKAETNAIFSKAPGYWSFKQHAAHEYKVEDENIETNGERTLCVFYVPGNQSQTYNWTFDFSLNDVKNEKGYNSWTPRPNITVYSLPLVTNKVTTIKGSFLSSYYGEGDISISIDDGLEEYTPEYGTLNF